MKCEKCERELIEGGVICGDCGHDSSLRRASLALGDDLPNHRLVSTSGNGNEANLIRFPKSAVSTTSTDDADSVPVWRNMVKERVRQFREQRPEAGSAEREFIANDGPQNPIVEAALKRLHKVPGTFSEQTGGASFSGATATSAARERLRDPVIEADERPATFRRDTAGLPPRSRAGSETPGTRIGSNTAPWARSVSATSVEKAQLLVEPSRSESSPSHSVQPLNPPIPATLWDRTLAGILDFLLIVIACIPLYSIHSIAGLRFGQSTTYAVLGIAIWITFLYQTWTMLLAGRTCGMAWRHLRVVDRGTRTPLFPQWRLFVRSICGTASLLFPPLNLAVIWASGTQSGLADLLSATMLLQTHIKVAATPPQAPTS